MVKEDTQFTKEALLKQDVKYADVLDAVKESRSRSGPATSRAAENMYDALMKYGIDFTEKAREGKLDPVIGRDDEIRRAIQILSRRTKNNPVFIGDPGVGKTAICEGNAQRMVDGGTFVCARFVACVMLYMDVVCLTGADPWMNEPGVIWVFYPFLRTQMSQIA